MTIWTATHPESVIPFIPGGSSAHTVSRFLNSTQQAICATVRDSSPIDDVCPAYINCVLDQLSSYASSGLGVGTTLLTLIPAALSLLPPSKLDAYSIWTMPNTSLVMRSSLVMLGAFSGFLSAGNSLKAMRETVESSARAKQDMKQETSLESILAKWNATDFTIVRTDSTLSPVVRYSVLLTAYVIAGLIIYASVVIGYLGIVTWACDHQPLALSWTLSKMAPIALEMVLTALTRFWLQRAVTQNRSSSGKREVGEHRADVEMNHLTEYTMQHEDSTDRTTLIGPSTTLTPVSRRLMSILKALEIVCKSLEGAVILWGTVVLGSMILIDGIPGMIFLLLIPGLYGLMHICLSAIVP